MEPAFAMEPTLMMQTASVLLTLTALGGLIMAAIRFRGKPHPPTWLAMLHGFLSSAALTLLTYAYFTVGLPGMGQVALALFLFAAAIGTYININYHWEMLPLPKGLVLAHAAIAGSGFVLLLFSTWNVSHTSFSG